MGNCRAPDLVGVLAQADRREHARAKDNCKGDQKFKGGRVSRHHGSGRRIRQHEIAQAERQASAVLEGVI